MSNHYIPITEADALIVCEALDKYNFQNNVDKVIAERVSNLIRKRVEGATRETNLDNKCGSCKWAKARHNSTIDCICPDKKENFFQRTQRACKHYEKEQKC